MPCPKCGSFNRSIGYEGGDEILCIHCKAHLVLIEPTKRHWSLFGIMSNE